VPNTYVRAEIVEDLNNKKTENILYVQRNIEARSCNQFSTGREITYSECAFVGLVTQHSVDMCHILICGLSVSAIFFHTVS